MSIRKLYKVNKNNKSALDRKNIFQNSENLYNLSEVYEMEKEEEFNGWRFRQIRLKKL